jgi:hypothetical protein
MKEAEASHSLPSHASFYNHWKEGILAFLQDSGIDDSDIVQGVLDYREDMWLASLASASLASASSASTSSASSPPAPSVGPSAAIGKPWEWLLTVAATGQRTTEWYAEAKRILTASEISAIWKGPRTRAALVLSKVPKEDEARFSRRLAVNRADTSPMDWGVRYEPVVKEILQESLGITIYELGRIHHRTVQGIAASPDGLITEGPVGSPLVGRLVEIKCPTTRVINETIPYDYWCQMQLQMEVCGINSCEYVEAKFKEFAADEPRDEANSARKSGWITLEANTDTMEMRYRYHPSFEAEQGDTMHTESPWISMETYRWECVHMRQVTVQRDQAWFAKIQPDIATFWKDVQGACDGSWTAPPSTRKPKPVAAPMCSIMDSGPEA